MSIEQSLDPQLIEQTKRQIRALVNEIAALAKSEVAPEEFHSQFLPRVVQALAAIGGAIWTIEDQGRLTLQYQMNLQETKLRESEEHQALHGRLLHRILTSGEGALVPPRSGFGEDAQAGNPTDFLLVFGLIKTELESIGLIEVFQRPDAGPATQKGYLRFLNEMCELAGDYFKSRQLRHFGDRQILWTQLEEFARGVHASLNPRDTAYTIANEGRRLIECDRVSVAIRRGRRCAIESVSGQDLFDKRSNTVRLLGRLATAVVNSGEPMWYTGDTSNMAPQVEDAVQEYVDESHSKCVAVLPLVRPRLEPEEDDPDKKEDPPEPIGALIVEQIEDSRVPQKMLQRVEVVTQHSSTALANSLEHQNLFLMPVWRAIGKARWIVKARTLPKTLAITGAAVAVILLLVLLPWDFKQHSEGSLEPVIKRDVFAGVDGVVDQVLVKHGTAVNGPSADGGRGSLMVKLRNTQLAVQLEEVEGNLRKTVEQLNSINWQLTNSSRVPQAEKNTAQLLSQRAQAEKEILTYRAQQALYHEQMKELEVYSPINGEVVTWDPENLLIQRPVQRGQVLVRVANPDGDWELELHMQEKKMGHITRARLDTKQRGPNEDLPVEFVLATDPDKKFYGKIKAVEENAEVRGEEGNTVLIKVAINKNELPQPLRPGASVSAKVACGKRALGYVLLSDAIAYAQKVWFRWF